MFGLIEKLRQKPDRTKKQIAFLIAFSIAGIIFVVWLSVIYPNWKSSQVKEAEALNSEPGPISSLSGIFSNGFSSISEQFSKIKETLSTFSTTPAYYSATSTSNSSISTTSRTE